jgi:aspartyl-tRNA(Asn)/glutamyl-tRNA(Gln) amidotransferase subunit C
MAPKLSREDVLRVADLARLELTEDEITRFTRQLADVLAYAEDVQRADTSGTPPTSHPLASETAWREDEPVPSLDRGESLERAPQADRTAGLFKVPKVL